MKNGEQDGKKIWKIYRTRAKIRHSLYIFYPIFKDDLFIFNEIFPKNSVLMYGFYSRAAYDGTGTVLDK